MICSIRCLVAYGILNLASQAGVGAKIVLLLPFDDDKRVVVGRVVLSLFSAATLAHGVLEEIVRWMKT